MGAIVNFYKYTGNPKKINKTFATTYSPKTINPTDFVDDAQPQLVMHYDSTIYNNANYAVIGSDCYFITDRGFDTAQRMVLYLEKDLLMTMKNQLMNVEVIADRSSNLYNSYIGDSGVVFKSNAEIINYDLGAVGTYDQSSMVVVAIGGKNT